MRFRYDAKLRMLGVCVLLLIITAWTGACSVLPPIKPRSVEYYQLELQWAETGGLTRAGSGPVIMVGVPETNAALNTSRMSYVHRSQTLSYFARSHWVDTPSRMLQPLITQALERQGGFAAVIQGAGTVRADLRLNTELLWFQQDFTHKPSRFRIGLRAQVIDIERREVLATRVFQAEEAAVTDNPHGGAVAASHALMRLLPELANFCAGTRAVPGEDLGA